MSKLHPFCNQEAVVALLRLPGEKQAEELRAGPAQGCSYSSVCWSHWVLRGLDFLNTRKSFTDGMLLHQVWEIYKKKAWESKLHIFFIIIIIFFGWMRCALYQFVEKMSTVLVIPSFFLTSSYWFRQIRLDLSNAAWTNKWLGGISALKSEPVCWNPALTDLHWSAALFISSLVHGFV